MAQGKDERDNPKRKVSKQEKGMTTFDMGGGATVQRILSPEAQRAESKPVKTVLHGSGPSGYEEYEDGTIVDLPKSLRS